MKRGSGEQKLWSPGGLRFTPEAPINQLLFGTLLEHYSL